VRAAGGLARRREYPASGNRTVFNTGDYNASRVIFHAHQHLLEGQPLGSFARRSP
jgi:diadenosine tetraphosphate (Ap4A) HIT family hydrolase